MRPTAAAVPEGVRSENRFRRLTYGTAASLLSQAVAVVSQLVLVPLLLAPWGTQRYGEWLSLSATVAYLSILDFGVQTYATNRLTGCRATGDQLQYTRVLHSAWALNVVLAVVAAIVAIPVLALIPFDRWLQLKVTDGLSAWMVASLLAMQTIAAIPFGLVTGVYRTVNEYPREQFSNTARQALTVAASVAVALAGGGLVAVAFAQLLALSLTGLYCCNDLRHRYPAIRLGWVHASRSMALQFLHPSLLFLLIQISGAAMLQGSTLMVSGMFGATGVATFVSLRTLANLSQQGIASVRAALWPEIAAMEATGDYHRLGGIHLMLTKVSMLLWFCAAVFLYFEGATVVRLWTKGRVAFDGHVMHALLILFGSYSLWTTSSVLLGASNRHRAMSWLYGAGCAAGLGFGYALAGVYGLAGMVYGLAAADFAICGIWIPRMACSIIGQSWTRYMAEVLGRGAIAAVPVVAAGLLFRAAAPIGALIPRIAALGLVVGLSGLASLFCLWLSRDEKLQVAALARAFGNRSR